MTNGNTRVVVTGMSAITPLGLTVEETWKNLVAGTSGAGPITRFDTANVATKFACEVKGFDPGDYIDRKAARRMDLYCQYSLSAAHMLMKEAALDPESMSQDEKDEIAVIVGSGIGGIDTFSQQAEVRIEKGANRMSPFFIPMLIPDIAAGQIAMKYGFRGPNYAAVSACATANNNVADAWLLIKNGMATAAIVGGSEAAIVEMGVGGFNANRALSTRNDSPETASRPFDQDRDGFVMGEGGGLLYVETLESAKKRGAKIYAELVGVGLSADAHHLTAPDPEGGGAALAMKRALKSAGMEPTDVDYINMHGTATPAGDIAETKAIKNVFGDHARAMSLSSTKSMTGHLLGAAGAVEAVASIMAIIDGVVPPTINLQTPDPECDLDYTPNEAKKREVSVAMSNAFGFGGHNTTLTFKKFSE
ncbi:MAG: beta-ketoacyl-ACP synthase II [Ignavibacteriales bacterium]|nr:beta-ketoacyl-ACP synthase II [Ignavibacteriales bacterium]